MLVDEIKIRAVYVYTYEGFKGSISKMIRRLSKYLKSANSLQYLSKGLRLMRG